MKCIMKASLGNKTTTTAKFENVRLRQFKNPDDFKRGLMMRKLNMDNDFIKQIHNDKETVLCVVKGVITTSDKAEITRTANTNGSILNKLQEYFRLKNIGTTSSDIHMSLESGTALAYKVLELKVNVNDGAITSVKIADNSEGFSSMDVGGDVTKDESDESSPLENLKDILQPLRDPIESDDEHFLKVSLLILMTCLSDAVALSEILSKAQNKSLNEDKDIADKQFVYRDAVWHILKCVGVQTEERTILYEAEATPILVAGAFVIDAILELEKGDLDKICQFSDLQLKTLPTIFESAVESSMPITIDEDMSSVLGESVSSFLTDLGFEIV